MNRKDPFNIYVYCEDGMHAMKLYKLIGININASDLSSGRHCYRGVYKATEISKDKFILLNLDGEDEPVATFVGEKLTIRVDYGNGLKYPIMLTAGELVRILAGEEILPLSTIH